MDTRTRRRIAFAAFLAAGLAHAPTIARASRDSAVEVFEIDESTPAGVVAADVAAGVGFLMALALWPVPRGIVVLARIGRKAAPTMGPLEKKVARAAKAAAP